MKPSFKENYTCKKKYRLDFGLSSNPLGPSPQVMPTLCANGELLAPYPEVDYPFLRETIASFYSCDKQDIFLGNGLDGLIYDIMMLILEENDELIIPEVTFRNAIYPAMYRKAKITQIPVKPNLSIDFDRMIQAISPTTKVIFLCNPNNPTGIYEPLEEIVRLLQYSPSALVIIDEANIEYSGGSCLYLTEQFPNLLVLRTFSKAYGLASMRIGYGVSRCSLLQELSIKRPPFCLTSLAALAACIALEDQEYLHHSVVYTKRECCFMGHALESLKFTVIPSQANTILCRIPASVASASDLVARLHRHDCHVVNGTFFNLPDQYLRIAPRLHSANVECISILKEIL